MLARPAGLRAHTELIRDPTLTPGLTQPAQAAHQHGVVLERLGRIDDAVQELVIARRREAERFADGAVLGDREHPALTLEIQDRARSVIERLGRGRAAHLGSVSTLDRGASTPGVRLDARFQLGPP